MIGLVRELVWAVRQMRRLRLFESPPRFDPDDASVASAPPPNTTPT